MKLVVCMNKEVDVIGCEGEVVLVPSLKDTKNRRIYSWSVGTPDILIHRLQV